MRSRTPRPARRPSFELALLGALALCGLGASCASSPPPSFREDLLGTCWRLVRMDGKAPLDEAVPTLCFDEQGGLSGTGGCNRYSGTAQFLGDGIEVGPLVSTRMACADAVMDQERIFLDRLGRARRWLLSGKTLLVYSEAPPALRFERESSR